MEVKVAEDFHNQTTFINEKSLEVVYDIYIMSGN